MKMESLKLKELGPKDLGQRIEGPEGAEVFSERKQWPNKTEGGCIAARGEECSMFAVAKKRRFDRLHLGRKSSRRRTVHYVVYL